MKKKYVDLDEALVYLEKNISNPVPLTARDVWTSASKGEIRAAFYHDGMLYSLSEGWFALSEGDSIWRAIGDDERFEIKSDLAKISDDTMLPFSGYMQLPPQVISPFGEIQPFHDTKILEPINFKIGMRFYDPDIPAEWWRERFFSRYSPFDTGLALFSGESADFVVSPRTVVFPIDEVIRLAGFNDSDHPDQMELQIRILEEVSRCFGLDPRDIPTGNKKNIEAEWRKRGQKLDLTNFEDTWKAARKQNRVRMRDNDKFAKRSKEIEN